MAADKQIKKFKQTKGSDFLSSPKEQGKRVRQLRALAGLNRNQLDAFQIKADTMRRWESGLFLNGISKSALKKILTLCEAHHIKVSPDWILQGIGAEPIKHQQILPPEKKDLNTQARFQWLLGNEHKAILEEIETFTKKHKDAVVFIIEDDGMAPQFMPGDYVAGIRFYHDEIDKLVGLDACIVEIENGQTLVRREVFLLAVLVLILMMTWVTFCIRSQKLV